MNRSITIVKKKKRVKTVDIGWVIYKNVNKLI